MVAISDHIGSLLWRQAVKGAVNTFVEVERKLLLSSLPNILDLLSSKGFAAAKKCTNEGRALMQLDFRQFVIQVLIHSRFLELITNNYILCIFSRLKN